MVDVRGAPERIFATRLSNARRAVTLRYSGCCDVRRGGCFVLVPFLVALALASPGGGTTLPPLPVDGATPLEKPAPASSAASDVPTHGAAPLDTDANPGSTGRGPSGLPNRGATPLGTPDWDNFEPSEERSRDAAIPLGLGPPPDGPPPPPDPRRTNMLRLDLLVGPTMRVRAPDSMVAVGASYGRMHGFAGTFHTEVIVGSDALLVQAVDVPIGVGSIVRGRLKQRPMYGSVGVTAGILVHRATTFESPLVHRVDPDFRVPIRLSWTIAGVGATLAIVQGYSVRTRSYERRGALVWRRHAYRIGILVGLHWDRVMGEARSRKSANE